MGPPQTTRNREQIHLCQLTSMFEPIVIPIEGHSFQPNTNRKDYKELEKYAPASS